MQKYNAEYLIRYMYDHLWRGRYGNFARILMFFGLNCVALPIHAGAFMFAGESFGVNRITHPAGYSGAAGQLQINVCIVPGSPNASQMEQPVRNAVATFNQLQATSGNFRNDIIPFNTFDFESTLIHELGHCVGVAHPNLGFLPDDGITGNDTNYTNSTDGSNNAFNINSGTDGVIGSNDDIRGDDVNLHWFRIANNNPFTIASVIDSTTYQRTLSNLPSGHSYATNADRTVGANLLSTPNTEAVMQQQISNSESRRTLGHDDVATLRLAMSGLDETQNTADDYTFNLNYSGITSANCNINVSFDNSQTGFAVCQIGGAFLSSTHVAITTANVYFNSGSTWHYNDTMPCNENLSLTANQWTMFSLPCRVGISTPNTVNDILGDDLSGPYATDWVVFERDAAAQVYNQLTPGSVMTPGTGYWIITTQSGQTVDIQGQDNAVLDIPLVADASGRQNMVGHTLNFNVDWANAQVIDGANVLTLAQADPNGACQGANPIANGCVVSRVMNKWNGSAYQTFDGQTGGMQGSVNRAESIWVNAFKAGAQLRIPFIAGTVTATNTAALESDNSNAWNASSDGSESVSNRASNVNSNSPQTTSVQTHGESEEYIRLIVESGDLQDPGNVLGFLADSRNGPDIHDLKELDPFGDTFLTAVFPHPKWGIHAGNYTSDYRSPKGKRRATWKFLVKSSEPNREVTLRWEGPKHLLKKSRLIDTVSGKKIRVQPNGSYTFIMDGNQHKFKWWMRRPKNKRSRS